MNLHKNSVGAGSVFVVVILLALQACSPNNVTIQDDYKKYFDETQTTGSFGLFDNGSGEFYIYNLAQFKDSSYAPASTFEIVNALVGIETGRIVDEKMVLSIDSTGPIRMDGVFPNPSSHFHKVRG